MFNLCKQMPDFPLSKAIDHKTGKYTPEAQQFLKDLQECLQEAPEDVEETLVTQRYREELANLAYPDTESYNKPVNPLKKKYGESIDVSIPTLGEK